jgi:hypothetical protein
MSRHTHHTAFDGVTAVAVEGSRDRDREVEWTAIGLYKALKAGYPESNPDPTQAAGLWLRPLREHARSHLGHERAQQLYLMGLNHMIYYATEAGHAAFAEALESEFEGHHRKYPNSEPVQYMVAARALDDVQLDKRNGTCPAWERRRHELRRLSEQFEDSDRIRALYLTGLTAIRDGNACGLTADQLRTLRLTFLSAAYRHRGHPQTGWHLGVYLDQSSYWAVANRDVEQAASALYVLSRLSRHSQEIYGANYAWALERVIRDDRLSADAVFARVDELDAEGPGEWEILERLAAYPQPG